jgi:uncharacterized protein (DUF1697 family)
MKSLKALFERLGFLNVSTYINSGNVLFESEKEIEEINNEIERELKEEAKEEIRVLTKTIEQMREIAESIPLEWVNDEEQRTDVAYLFEEANREEIIQELPIKLEYIRIKYINGAIMWNVERKDYNKSQLNKIISHRLYKQMTVRNVNTARYLAS